MSEWADARAAICDLEARYGAGIDRRDVELVAGCFTEDAVADYGGAGHLEGGRHIAETLVERASTHLVTTHFIGGPLVDLDGDRAWAETPCLAYLLAEEGPSARMRVRAVRYQDSLVLRDGRWRIARRRHGADWQVDVVGDGRECE